MSKGALYLYFETKQHLFEAVVTEAVLPNIEAIERVAGSVDIPFATLARMLVARVAEFAGTSPLGSVVKMVIAESGNFPDLARVWHDRVVSRALRVMTSVIERAQARGEVRPGDPRFHAFSVIGPMLMGVIWREVLQPAGGAPVDLRALAAQHIETALGGLLEGEAQA